MSWTKKQIIDRAFAELGLGAYTHDMEPEQYTNAILTLDSMIAGWVSTGMKFAYNLSSPASTSLEQDSLIPDWLIEAIYLNLAIRIAPSMGKVVAPETKTSAIQAYNTALRNIVKLPTRSTGIYTVAGAGYNNRSSATFIPREPDDELEI